jgi:branched-chain amino acid transport system permease protein
MGAAERPISAAIWVVAALLLVGAALLVFVLPPFELRLAQQILLFGGMAVAWSLLGGFTSYWSFGHTAFFGLGAFAAGLLGQHLGPGFPVAYGLLIGLLSAVVLTLVAAVAIAIPVLKLRGIYFAIAMLAFAEILGEVSKSFDFFHGSTGFPLRALSVPGLHKVQLFYLLFLLLFVVSVAAYILLRRSRLGTGLTCIGQDEDTAAMLGIPTERYKLIAFVLSAVLTAVGGVLYGYSLGFISTGSVFRIDISLNLVLYSMLGGIGTVAGPIIGAAIMIILTQVLLGDLLDLHMMVTGAVLIAIVIVAPRGLMGLLQKSWSRREGAMAEARS